MNTWKVILATMVIFGAGVVTGGLLVHHVGHVRFHPTQHAPPLARPAQPVALGGPGIEFLHRMERELDVTPDQREHIDKMIKQSQERSRIIMEPVRPQIIAESRRREEEFRAVLTPEQRTRFDEMLKQLQRSHEPRRQPPQRERPAENTSGTTAPGATNQ